MDKLSKKQMLEHPGVFQKWPDSVITSDRYENVDVEWLWQLVLSQIDFKKSVREILQQMKKTIHVFMEKACVFKKMD